MRRFADDRFAAVGTVYGVLLNDRATVARLRESFLSPPYRQPPRAPVLYIKSRNTFAADGCDVAVPREPGVAGIGGTVGAVIGTRATKVRAVDAASHVAGFVIASDVSLPHDSYYRPAVRERCRDGFCPIGVPSLPHGFDVDAAEVVISIDDAVVHRRSLSTLVRGSAALLADISEFMTLEPGDVVLLGLPDEAPLARPGERVRIDVPGLGSLSHGVVAEPAFA